MTYEDVILTTACPEEYTIRRTYSVFDCDENLAQHIQDITIDDSTAPEFTSFPADVDVECDAVPGVEALVNLAASDNCDGCPSISYDGEVRIDGDCADSTRWSAAGPRPTVPATATRRPRPSRWWTPRLRSSASTARPT